MGKLFRKVAEEVFAVKHFYSGYENLIQMPNLYMIQILAALDNGSVDLVVLKTGGDENHKSQNFLERAISIQGKSYKTFLDCNSTLCRYLGPNDIYGALSLNHL